MAQEKMTRGAANAIDTMTILDTIAYSGSGMTVGELGKIFAGLTRRQLQTILNNLMGAGFVACEVKAHGRTGKKVYILCEYAAMIAASIARNYTQGGGQ